MRCLQPTCAAPAGLHGSLDAKQSGSPDLGLRVEGTEVRIKGLRVSDFRGQRVRSKL